MQKNTILLFLFLSLSALKLPDQHLIKDHEQDIFSLLPADSPCADLSVSEEGISCKIGEPFWETTLFLAFPHLFIDEEKISSIPAFPSSSISETVDFLKIPIEEGSSFFELKQVRIKLSLHPVTPTYLMPYLSDIWPFWGGNRVPYMLKWEVSYLLLVDKEWEARMYSGKLIPADIPNLQDHLAADVDYNGVPSAFWNYQVELSK